MNHGRAAASDLPDGLIRGPGEQVAAAVRQAGRGNLLLAIDIGQQGQPTRQLCRPHTRDSGAAWAGAARLVDAVGAWLGTDQRRVAASMVVLGYAARLVGPAVAVLLRDDLLLDLRPAQVRYAFTDQGFRLALTEPAGWTGPPEAVLRGWCQIVVDGHLWPLVEAVRAVAPVAPGLLWGNVASGLAGALQALHRSGAVPVERCHRTGLVLLGYGPLAGTGRLSVDGGGLRFVRASCCLYYRLDGGGMCGDCALLPANRTAHRAPPGSPPP